jgi:hypothetical protein
VNAGVEVLVLRGAVAEGGVPQEVDVQREQGMEQSVEGEQKGRRAGRRRRRRREIGNNRRVRFSGEMRMPSYGGTHYVGEIVDKDRETDLEKAKGE